MIIIYVLEVYFMLFFSNKNKIFIISLTVSMWCASFETPLFVLKGQFVGWPYEVLLVNVDFQSIKDFSSFPLSPISFCYVRCIFPIIII